MNVNKFFIWCICYYIRRIVGVFVICNLKIFVIGKNSEGVMKLENVCVLWKYIFMLGYYEVCLKFN